MSSHSSRPPVILAFSAHDPSGAAGIQADIESINANGAFCVSVLTALTAQNTARFETLIPQTADAFRVQARLLLDDIQVDAFKIGLIGSAELVHEIATILKAYPDKPVVLDPVLHAGTGTGLADDQLIGAIRRTLLPLVTVLTPNVKEARKLADAQETDRAAAALLAAGCNNVLITGADEPTAEVVNTLYSPGSPPNKFHWERLPGIYHGSGCTLAAAIAARLALGDSVPQAVERAQNYCWQTLKQGRQLGRAQLHPDRSPRSK